MKKTFTLWFPVLLWAGLIFTFSGIPDLRTDLEYDFFLRKVAHVTEYFILTFLLWRAMKGSFAGACVRLMPYTAVLSFLYAISDEIHQSFVPGRACAWQDVLIDTAGIALFLGILWLWRKRKVTPSSHCQAQ